MKLVKSVGELAVGRIDFIETYKISDTELSSPLGTTYDVVEIPADQQKARDLGIAEEQTGTYALIQFPMKLFPFNPTSQCDLVSADQCTNATDKGLKAILNSGEAWKVCTGPG